MSYLKYTDKNIVLNCKWERTLTTSAMLQFEKQNSIFWVNNETGREKTILLDTQKRYYIYTPIFDWFCERRTKKHF